MKKIAIAVLAVLLVISLASCDEAVEMMGAMGNSVLGVDPALLENVKEATTVSDEDIEAAMPEKTLEGDQATAAEAAVGTVNSSYGIGFLETGDTEVAIVNGTGGSVIMFGESTIDLPTEVTSILPPADLQDAVSALTGSAKDAVLEELAKPADDTTKAAAQGTATVVSAVLSEALDGGSAPAEVTEFLEAINDIASAEEVSKADVLMLQAATSLVSSLSGTINDVVSGSSSEVDASTLLGEETVSSVSAFLQIATVTGGSSTLSDSFLSMLDSLMGSN